MFFTSGIWCLAEILSVFLGPLLEQSAPTKELMLETSATCKHHIPQVKNIPDQPLLIKLIYNLALR